MMTETMLRIHQLLPTWNNTLYLLKVSNAICKRNVIKDISRLPVRTKTVYGTGHYYRFSNFCRLFKSCTGVRCDSAKIARYRKVWLIAFSPFSIFKRNLDANVLSTYILSNIPKEVFTKDVLFKKDTRIFFKRLFTWLWEVFRIITRFVYIMCLFSPLLCTYPLTYASTSLHTLWLHTLRWTLEHAGPTYIKLGQWASTRRDIFSDELCEVFSKLHDNIRIHSWYMTKKKLRKAFGKRWRLLFEKFEKVPIGSGCIGQVHRAYMCSDMIPDESIVEDVLSVDESDEPDIDFAEGLEIIGFHVVDDEFDDRKEEIETEKEREERRKAKIKPAADRDLVIASTGVDEPSEGKHADYPNEQIQIVKDFGSVDPILMEEVTLIPVAVKVLHPGIYRHVQRDLKILRFFAKIVETLFPSLKWIGAKECIAEFSHLMIRQVDLRYEADCLEKFGEQFESNPNIRFPRPIRPYCKRDVLIETLEEGEPIHKFLSANNENDTDESQLDTRMSLKQKLASYGINALLHMVFVNNFVHGDLHPGNIFVQNATNYTPQDESKLMVVDICDTTIVSMKPIECSLRLVFLDVGISTSLEPNDLTNLRNVITAVILGQDEKVAGLMLKHARYDECKNAAAFETDMASVVKQFRSDALTLGKVQVGQLLSNVFRTCCRHRVKMESNFASTLLAIFVLEGIGRSLDPDLNILDYARCILLADGRRDKHSSTRHDE